MAARSNGILPFSMADNPDPSADLLVRISEQLEELESAVEEGHDGGGSPPGRWDWLAERALIWIVALSVFAGGAMFTFHVRLSRMEETRFTAEDGLRLQGDIVKQLNDHRAEPGHSVMQRRMDDHISQEHSGNE